MTKLNIQYYKGSDLYSDGDVENDILEIVKSHRDFTDVLAQDSRWPVFYHLTPHRQSLLAWYPFEKDKSLLEIGGGCGAFSGLFAEKLGDVKVVELSRRRAEIIYQRHQDYDNLEVIVGNLNDIKFADTFDYVTLIGVLEYAGKFTEGNNPYLTFLQNIKQHIKNNGKLILAIENRYGMKYWAGAKEDHTGRYFDGIEGYPEDHGIRTFGKVELESLLREAGFSAFEFYYPMPDYKLPKVVYSDSFLPQKDAFFDAMSPNFDQERMSLFNENLAYKGIIDNEQFPFFANSFLVIAS